MGTGAWSLAGDFTGAFDDWTTQCPEVPSPGEDAEIKVEVLDGEYLWARYQLGTAADASLLLVDSCAPGSHTCAENKDVNATGEHPSESLIYLNDSGDTETLYLVLDEWDLGNTIPIGPYTLALDIGTTATDQTLKDVCTDPSQITLISTPGMYRVSMAGMNNSWTLPTGNSCTLANTSEKDGHLRIEIPIGVTVTVTVRAVDSDGDPSIYFLKSCTGNIDTDCVKGMDKYWHRSESLTYTNDSGGAKTLILVVDGADGDFTEALVGVHYHP
ncbi:MAG: hypothetical protein JRJ84_04695 [Deltaproteobacteria bacterium]|nr:hypothetical protein [Deltaproteobacteria bacterium]